MTAPHRTTRPIETPQPRALVVASAFPDPPFDVDAGGSRGGFDVELMRAVCAHLGYDMISVAYTGADFNGIFDGLGAKEYDVVISGTTITPEREARVLFSRPYLEFNQGVAVNRLRSPGVGSVGDLRGLTAGIQSGNTSDSVAKKLLASDTLAGIHYYPYGGLADALSDLEAGQIGCVIKLFPVLSWVVKDRPMLAVPFQIPTSENLGIAFAKENTGLRDAVDAALDLMRASGEFARLAARWFPKKCG